MASWLVTSTVIVGAIANPLLGRLGDQYGRLRLLLIALGAFVLGSVICAVAGTVWVMIIGRAIQGISTAAIPLGIGLLAAIAPPQNRARGIALVSAMLGIGGAAGLPLAGIIAAAWGVAGVFWCSAAVGGLVLLATVIFVPAVPTPSLRGPSDLAGAALLALGLVAMLLPVSQGNVWGWGSLITLTLLVLAALTVTGFILVELRHVAPVIDIRRTMHRPILLTNTAAVLLGFAFFLSFLAAMTLLQAPTPDGYGLPVALAGLCMVPGGILMVVAAPVAARAVAAIGPRITLIVAGVIVSLGFVIQFIPGGSILQLIASTSIASAGIAVAYAAMPGLILDASPARTAAAATGVNALARYLGSAIGSATFGMVAGVSTLTLTTLTPVWALGAGAAVLAVVAASSIARPRADPPSREDIDQTPPPTRERDSHA